MCKYIHIYYTNIKHVCKLIVLQEITAVILSRIPLHPKYASFTATFKFDTSIPLMTVPPPGRELRQVFQRGAAEPEERVPAPQGQDPRVQYPHGYCQQDRG